MDEYDIVYETPAPGPVARWVGRLAQWMLTAVRAVPVGRPNDGLYRHNQKGGTEFDRDWHELESIYTDVRAAMRTHPMVRRMVGLITSYVVGPGIQVSSEKKSFNSFISDFWNDPENKMDLRQSQWCDELTGFGELFIALFPREDGTSVVRTIPPDFIVEVDYDPNDYERELRYQEKTDPGEPEKWWYSQHHPKANERDASGELPPIVLHFAINKLSGMVRGESDLAPVLKWAKRYDNWLADRVSLNAAMRSFYWVVYAANHLKAQIRNTYTRPPAPGSIIVAEEGAERWEAVAPNLNARDAKEDGRAIRWMIAAGGLGTTLADFGESEEAGLTKGTDTSEQRRRFLLRRQRHFIYMLSEILVVAYNRKVEHGYGRSDLKAVSVNDVTAKPPDISVDDNTDLATSTSTLMDALTKLRGMLGDTDEFRKLALRLAIKHLGEQIATKEFEALLAGDPVADARAAAEAAAVFPPDQQGNGGGQAGARKKSNSE